MSTTVGAALDAHLRAIREPVTLDQVAAQFGKTTTTQNTAMAAELAGTGVKTDRAYKAALRRVQRWRTTGAQRRRPSATAFKTLQDAARERLIDRRVQRALRHGLNVVIRADIRVSRAIKVHTMPAPMAGATRFQPIDGAHLGPALAAWIAGNLHDAGEELLDAFFVAYGLGAQVFTVHYALVRGR